jgi:hypothetical protein
MKKDRFLILLASLLIFIILDALLTSYTFGSRIIDLAWLILFFSCINAISDTKKQLAISLLLFFCSIAARLTVYIIDDSFYERAGQSFAFAFSAIFYAYTGFLIIAYALKGGKVTRDKIAAAICVYLIIGAIWSMLYGLVDILDPDAFRISADAAMVNAKPFGYFSYITLTTVGYGDITPLSASARSLAMVEGIIGQIYIAVMIARLVGLYIAHSTKEQE